MSQYLLVTIGPVQSYIAQSRKTIDLFNSSKIIGDILKKIVEEIKPYLKYREDIEGIEILLPSMNIEEYCQEDNSIPNYFIVELSEDNSVFRDIENTVKKIYEKVLYDFKKEIERKFNGTIRDNELQEHISDIFDIYSVKVESDNYKKAYDELYEKLEMFKNIRIFNHYFGIGEAGKKCTICGQRNSIFNKNSNNTTKRVLSEKEHLCCSCYIKRIYDNKESNFPSTASIAVMGWEGKNDENNLKNFKNEIKKILGDTELYEACYYYKDVVLNEAKKKDKVKKCEKIFADYDEKLFSKYKPTKYYALVKCDIDDLGKWMSGKYFKTNNFLEEQKKLSKKIIEFGKSIEKQFADRKLGRTIYTGGDDFLLFVTLEELFSAIKLLDDGMERINNELKNYNKKLTISKSITIAHYTTPLQNVINITSAALEQVKTRFKERESSKDVSKNGIVITFITRSNTYRTTMFKNTTKINADIFEFVINEFKKNNIAKSFITQLKMNFKGFDAVMEYGEMLNIKQIFESEARRLLARKSEDESNVADILLELLNQGTIELGTNSYRLDYTNVFNFLHIASNISRELLKGE
ncbi:type III-B CRISPR-associated protein Cas10/Cmr2 [Paramaledivibacter caminithermalis]|jgi:CRISPR-associated protein Cmr2|uniref:CRISPR-associated protein n=1 Tax=Paramaledivibacter caminithermalis (strain DSM 15212 / CIP 107654 / DViRD3) TaxID=1121301 RepID=A0A1M6QT50_PARC5|nr:type III-B CRISPR-associated protein Cas10/Cmr2 [Paramaledivibacter caminithermalis]SHK23394.1 CRISPR-associated protein [Paramaledivibacter caminithermalis DSM 15212]